MALAEFHFTSNNSLGRQMSAMIIVPEKKPGPFPVLYLLHGHSDDHTAWTRFSNIERYVGDLPLIVVMPDTERGWYVDAQRDPSKKFESMIIKDLVPFVDDTFRTVGGANGRAIAGLSMGGYGSLRLALKYPDMFCAAHGFSSGFRRGSVEPTDEEGKLVFGESPVDTDYDVSFLAKNIDKMKAPRISFDCGIDDMTLESNRALDKLFTELGIAHTYTEYPGKHNWAYWNEHVLIALPALMSALKIDAKLDLDAELPNRSAPLTTPR